ncbi:hypothetical protein LTR37_015052 [Vermiconidia calcicola]|uniref:Uncharacterized protein n=1 Tax=Vermiconidia calcicola TaxID=1690605 RepID=A0ACC3MSL5_9PEZI|nr:hypothetical protein LTR37_015052 [Vermiconidia calcicola]
MADTATPDINIPSLPAKHDHFIEYISAHPKEPMLDLLEPYKQYDTEMRKVYAQQPDHPAASQPNIVPVFAGHEKDVRIRARNLKNESQKEKECYIMPLNDDQRRPDGSPAIVQSVRDFKTNFNVFSESSLVDLNWSNVVVAGSAVVTSLLAVPKKHAKSKRALRRYYHDELAPASDVDLFLYGLTEEQATQKIKQIEQNVRDALLVETTTIRTKNTIMIVSKHPVRHVQIVLRIYKSISEILTGFDVDCSCAAYDGSQVYASPRAVCAYMTQSNSIDLTRRSPSYENRLSKYARRGFEVHWPSLDRSKIDPTIYERSFARTEGLSRLLILEKLPKSDDREAYLDQRREERGRPAANRRRQKQRQIYGNIKNDFEDEIAEWADDEVSSYHSFTIPYGPKFNAKKIEKLLYTKDMLMNAEWNQPKDREVNLHRHPAFFGTVEDVIGDCCGYCPEPTTVEEEEVAEEESKIFVSGSVQFMKDDPGRQAIGSFHPITADDWTSMAYVGNTAQLCQAIVDGDLEYVQGWLAQEGNDPDTRDYTGRTPLHLAVANSSLEVIQALIDSGARLVARLVDGKTALHLAAIRGDVDIVSALLRKSEANEEEEEKKLEARRAARKAKKEGTPGDVAMQDAGDGKASHASNEDDSDIEMVENPELEGDENMDATTENSMVNIKSNAQQVDDMALANEESEDDPDVYDVNVVAWDTAVSPLHLAIVNGHQDVVKCLVEDFGADVLLPIKLFNDHDKSARAAILTLVLALQLPHEQAKDMTRTLLRLGASSAQASIDQTTALQYCVADSPDMLDTLGENDETGIKRAINHLSVSGQYSPELSSPLMTAIKARDSLTALKLLTGGAKAQIDFATYVKAYQMRYDLPKDSKRNKKDFEQRLEQPVLSAVNCELPLLAKTLVDDHGIDPNTLSTQGYRVINDDYTRRYTKGESLLDVVQEKIKSLKEWEFEAPEVREPTPLKEDSEYLDGLDKGSYAFWSAQKQLDAAKKRYKDKLERYEKDLESSKDRTGVAEKQDAIDRMIGNFEQLEAALIQRGAKTFADLHPEVEEPEKRQDFGYSPYDRDEPPKPFQIEINFQIGDLTDEAQKRYETLFEASWNGDTKAVKALTLQPWTSESEDDQPPAKIAVKDQHNLSPFALAVLRGHLELATVIMDIAKAQHIDADPPKQKRYDVDPGDSDEASEDEVQLYSEVVDDEFTIETVGEVSMQVKSRVLPTEMLQWPCRVVDFAKSRPVSSNQDGSSGSGTRRSTTMAGKRTNTGSIKLPSPSQLSDRQSWHPREPDNLLELALYNNDSQLLTFLLDLGQDYYQMREPEYGDTPTTQSFTVSHQLFKYGVVLDHPHLLAEMIKRTGAAVPLDSLAKQYGGDIKEKPKYYQGLSVYGKKRKDWADAGRNQLDYSPVQKYRPPMLVAANSGSIKTVEWFLSDAPMRCYMEFFEAHRDDKRIERLVLSNLGFDGAVKKFLNTRSQLAIHCCLMGWPTVEADRLLRYLVEIMPDTLESKSVEGLTPLQIAFQLYHEDAVKILIAAGADQTCRDKSGKNILHHLLSRSFTEEKEVQKLKQMLELIDDRVLPTLFTERSTGSLTPLHFWLTHQYRSNEAECHEQVMRLLLKHSGGQELGLISGEGDTPLHRTVKIHNVQLTRVILEHDASLLNRENATGRTPFEMAENSELAAVCDNPPPMPNHYSFSDRRAKKYGLNTAWNTNLLDRSAGSFAEPAVEGKSDRDEVWEMLKETKTRLDAEGKAKRRLVTLGEANEVAKRLAAMKSSKARRGDYEDDEEKSEMDEDEDLAVGDEVQAYLGSARRSA